MDYLIKELYIHDGSSSVSKHYFESIVKLYCAKKEELPLNSLFDESQMNIYPCNYHKILCLAIFKSGDSSLSIRTAAVELFKVYILLMNALLILL
jgi:hypothetical protein